MIEKLILFEPGFYCW